MNEDSEEVGLEVIAEQIAERTRYYTALRSRKHILLEAFKIMQEFGEEETCQQLLTASKRIGSRLEA